MRQIPVTSKKVGRLEDYNLARKPKHIRYSPLLSD
jgi:hypothetical protein